MGCCMATQIGAELASRQRGDSSLSAAPPSGSEALEVAAIRELILATVKKRTGTWQWRWTCVSAQTNKTVLPQIVGMVGVFSGSSVPGCARAAAESPTPQ